MTNEEKDYYEYHGEIVPVGGGFRYSKAYQRFQESVRWDYNLLTKQGESLEDIAEEVYGDRTCAQEIFECNNAERFLRENPNSFWADDPDKLHKRFPLNDKSNIKSLPEGLRLRVYMGPRQAGMYSYLHPERDVRSKLS